MRRRHATLVRRHRTKRALPGDQVHSHEFDVRDPETDQKRTGFDRAILSLLRHLLPPHWANDAAAAHLDRVVGKDSAPCRVVRRPPRYTDQRPDLAIRRRSPVRSVFFRPPYCAIQRGHVRARLDSNCRALADLEVQDARHHERSIDGFGSWPIQRLDGESACLVPAETEPAARHGPWPRADLHAISPDCSSVRVLDLGRQRPRGYSAWSRARDADGRAPTMVTFRVGSSGGE